MVIKDIYKLWIDAGWRGHAETHHFGAALYAFFSELSSAKEQSAIKGTSGGPGLNADDQAAFDVLTLPLVQHAVLAVDVDRSGVVTVASVNRFTLARPEGWRCVDSVSLARAY